MTTPSARFIPKTLGMRMAVIVAAIAAVAWFAYSTSSRDHQSTSVDSVALQRAAAVRVTGDVRSNTDEQLATATICAYGTSTAQLDRYCVTSDAQGVYSLELVPGRYSVTASAANHASVTSSLATEESQSARLNFTLERQAPTIAGIIKSAAGVRINAARVAVYQGVKLVSNVSTNDKGEFTAWTPPGSLEVNVDAEGFGAAIVQTVAPTMDIVVTLYPGNVVTGQVLLEGSLQPVPNVHVTAASRADRIISQLRDAAVQTDERGRFAFTNLSAGAWILTVADQHVWGALAKPIIVTSGTAENEITLMVKPAGEVFGRFVVGDAAQPCPSGRLHLTPEAMARQAESNPTANIATAEPAIDKAVAIPLFTAATAEDGAIRFDAVPYGTYRVGPICKEHQWADGPTLLEITGATTKELLWKFTSGLGVTVRVVDEAGQPIADAAVALSLQSDQPLPRAQMIMAQRSGSTDTDGKYRFGGLRAGRYQLSARYAATNGKAVATEIADLQSDGALAPITLTLLGKGTIRIHSHTPAGAPISRVLFFATDGAGVRYEGSYRGDGLFVIGPLPRDQYQVYGYDNKNAKLPLNGGGPVRIASAEPVDIDFSYDAPTALLEGRVTDANGAPQSGVLVRAVSVSLDEDDELYSIIQSTAHGGQEQMTDQTGSFRVEGLKSQAAYDLYVDHQSGLKDVRRSVTPGNFVDIALPAAATVTGTVVSADGKPVANFGVLVNNKEANVSRSESFSNINGEFKIDQVHPGLLEIAVYSDDDRSVQREVRIAPGQTTHMGRLMLSVGDNNEQTAQEGH